MCSINLIETSPSLIDICGIKSAIEVEVIIICKQRMDNGNVLNHFTHFWHNDYNLFGKYITLLKVSYILSHLLYRAQSSSSKLRHTFPSKFYFDSFIDYACEVKQSNGIQDGVLSSISS